MQMAVRPASVSRRSCALAAVTIVVENACAASCKALAKTKNYEDVCHSAPTLSSGTALQTKRVCSLVNTSRLDNLSHSESHETPDVILLPDNELDTMDDDVGRPIMAEFDSTFHELTC